MIVNADSAQLYADLPILSAAPSPAERRVADHRLYGVRDGAQAASAAEWAGLAKAEIASIHQQERLPILVGGTGLYLRTLTDGIAPVPPIDPAVRRAVRSASTAENLAALVTIDPVAAATLNPGDSARIARALEVARSTGKSLKSWQQQRSGGIGGQVRLVPLILLPPRDWLYDRCDRRFAQIVETGAAHEVEQLTRRGLDPSLPVMRAIGVQQMLGFNQGAISKSEAIAAGTLATRRYAKRQYTWFSNQPPADWPRFTEALDEPGAMERALALLDAAE